MKRARFSKQQRRCLLRSASGRRSFHMRFCFLKVLPPLLVISTYFDEQDWQLAASVARALGLGLLLKASSTPETCATLRTFFPEHASLCRNDEGCFEPTFVNDWIVKAFSRLLQEFNVKKRGKRCASPRVTCHCPMRFVSTYSQACLTHAPVGLFVVRKAVHTPPNRIAGKGKPMDARAEEHP